MLGGSLIMSLRRLIFALTAFCLLSSLAAADAASLRGFVKGEGYQYALFGAYPFSMEGEEAPVLWRILGPGTPEDDDLNNAANDIGYNKRKYATGDALSGENADVFCLMTEYIIDFTLYHDTADTADGPALDYKDTQIRSYMNDVLLPRLLTEEEQSVLVEDIKTVDAFLTEQKGYGGFFGLDKKTRLMHAAMIVSCDYVKNDNKDVAAMTGTLAAVAAQQAAMCAVIAASTAASAANAAN